MNMNFIQQQLEKQQGRENKNNSKGKKPPTKLAKPVKSFKPMRAK